MVNRQSPTELPTIEKAVGDKMYHSLEDAEKELASLTGLFGSSYGIYKVIVVVEERV